MSRSDRSGEAGFTAIEVVVASMILVAALAVFLGGLVSVQRTASYESHRGRALDDLRTTAGVFAKDARHAKVVKSISPSTLIMETYVSGTLQEVKYEVVGTGADRNLLRTTGGGSRLFVIRLTSASIFDFDSTEPALVRQIELHMETQPQTQYPPVVLATEVSLRNVTT